MTKSMHLLVYGVVLLAALILMGCPSQRQQAAKSNKKISTMSKVEHLSKSEFLAKVANYEQNPQQWKYLGDKPAIIDFYASWCGPCKALAPVLDELSNEYAEQIHIYKVDTEAERDLAAAFGIRSIPTLLFVPMNGNPQIAQGALPKTALIEAINQVLLGKE